ncbi:hypothetical protein ZIOFF_050790 [Zingiber officinale]|uniref:Reverse transcriptase Ty1/copia-type domain-containing protein n=1 Tax=Zingiber officinale TaxID=94328 RepID=A0A8J5FJF3_ZINOF|nr:hypothetical protein ZIOFF_050790 [Zingiber officinale]
MDRPLILEHTGNGTDGLLGVPVGCTLAGVGNQLVPNLGHGARAEGGREQGCRRRCTAAFAVTVVELARVIRLHRVEWCGSDDTDNKMAIDGIRACRLLQKVDAGIGQLMETLLTARITDPPEILQRCDASSVDVVVCKLHIKFAIKDLGALSLFYGIEVRLTSNGLLLSQQKYVIDLLSKLNMLDSKLVYTPIAAGSRLTFHDGSSSFDTTKF